MSCYFDGLSKLPFRLIPRAAVALVASMILLQPAYAQKQRFPARSGSHFAERDFAEVAAEFNPELRVETSPPSEEDLNGLRQVDAQQSADYDQRPSYLLGDGTSRASYIEEVDSAVDDFVEQVAYCDEPSCGCDDPACGCPEASCGCDSSYGCEASCGCDDGYCDVGSCKLDCGSCIEDPCCSLGGCEASCGGSTFQVGVEYVLLKPRFSQNNALTVMTSNGASVETFTERSFDYDLEFSPRVWLGMSLSDHWGWRVTWWEFDESPAVESASPANGFGRVSHPHFGDFDPVADDIDISTNVPSDVFTAASGLDVYTIDLEALKRSRLNAWNLEVGYGIRYASSEQNYLAELRNSVNTLRGRIDFHQNLEGFGPTVSLAASRPLFGKVRLMGSARGSLLFGDGESVMVAGEDLDLSTPFTTTRTTLRDDLLSIGEARVGLQWLGDVHDNGLQWMFSTAMEGQIWGNAGSASSEDADLGFFGFNVGGGVMW